MAKILETHNLSDYEIWTDTGWEEINAVHKTVEYQVWEIHTKDFFLKCADEHIVFDENYKEIFVKDLKEGDKILTERGPQKITSIKIHDNFENMYDVSLVGGNHRFYSNGILSHNTTLMTIYALWLSCFESDQRIVVVANREQTAINVFKRIRLAYEQLPNFLKPGVKEYGKTGLTFDNDSSIGVSTTTSTAVRGESISSLIIDEMAFIECLAGDTTIKLKNEKTGEIKNMHIEELYKSLQNV